MNPVPKQTLMMKPLFAALLLASLDANALGQQVPTNAGSILQQLQPSIPVPAQPPAPTLEVKPKNEIGVPPSQPIQVNKLRIVGNTAFSTETLHALVADQEGKSLTLAQLEELAGRITAFYQARGFQVTRAIIPAQSITGGVVVIQVVEAHYGSIRLNNRTEVNDAVLGAVLASLGRGDLIADDELNRTLLLLSDVPGVAVNAVLKPGTAVGTSDLDVEARHIQSAPANFSLDNYGNPYIGRTRLSGNFNLVNPLHAGDILSANLTTTGDGMSYFRAAYDTLLNGQGSRIGTAFSALRYKLGGAARTLDAHGTASVGSVWAKHPFIRTAEYNLYAQLQYEAKKLRDRVDVGALRTDRHLRNWVVSVNGDQRDSLLGGAMSTASLSWTRGRHSFDDAGAAASDAVTARATGAFSKWNINLVRLQGLTPRTALYFSLTGQWSDRNLDSAEKMAAGGPYTVRAYDIGAFSGDTGYAASMELRHELGRLWLGTWQAQAFIDNAHVKINRQPWNGNQNSGSMSGAGVGMNWIGPDQWRASASVATRLGAVPALLGKQSSAHAWLLLSKGF